MPDPEKLALALFAIINGARVLAYVPQILLIRNDTQGAVAVSCTTWTLFALSHLSTAIYAAVVSHDAALAIAFVVNAAGCAVIVALAFQQRQRYRRRAPASIERRAASDGWLAMGLSQRTARSAVAREHLPRKQALT